MLASRLTLAAAVALPLSLAVPAVASACDDSVPYSITGADLREADFSGGGGPLGRVKLDVGDRVTGGRVEAQRTYYVPRSGRAEVRVGKTSYRLSGGSVFLASCSFTSRVREVRLLRGRASVSGPVVRNRPTSTLTTPEASFAPLPGRPRYTVTRVVTNSMKRTRSRVKAARGASSVFVNIIGPNSAQVPCQAGKAVTVYLSGRYRTG